MPPSAVDFVLVFLLFSCVDVSGLSNETIWNSLNKLFNRETNKLVLLLNSSPHRNPRAKDEKEGSQRGVNNIWKVIKNGLHKLPYENEKKEALRRDRSCQRLESCFSNCKVLRAGRSCGLNCQKAFDAANKCAKTTTKKCKTTPDPCAESEGNGCEEREEDPCETTTTCRTKKTCKTTTCPRTGRTMPPRKCRRRQEVDRDYRRSNLLEGKSLKTSDSIEKKK